MRKRSAQLNKAVGYIRGKIRRKSWSQGDKIDSINKMSGAATVSNGTMLRAVQLLELAGLLENRGREGIWIIGRLTSRMSTIQKLAGIKNNILTAKMLASGGIFDSVHRAVLLRKENVVSILFPITGKTEEILVDSILKVRSNMIKLEDVLKPSASSKQIKEYREQVKVLSLLELIIPHKTELELVL